MSSSDLENGGQGHRLKNNYISAIIWPILTKISLNDATAVWDWQQSDTLADLENEGQGHILQSNISYFQTSLNQIFFSNDDAHTGIVAVMCAGSHFFTLDNCLLYMDTPTYQPVICGSLL